MCVRFIVSYTSDVIEGENAALSERDNRVCGIRQVDKKNALSSGCLESERLELERRLNFLVLKLLLCARIRRCRAV